MISTMVPPKPPFSNTMPSAAGKKHGRDDGPSTLTLASTSKKRVRFAAGAVPQAVKASDGEDSGAATTITTTTTATEGAQKVGGRSVFKKFVVSALDERAIVGSSSFLFFVFLRSSFWWDGALIEWPGIGLGQATALR